MAGLARSLIDLWTSAPFWAWAKAHIESCKLSPCGVNLHSACRQGASLRISNVNEQAWPWPCLQAFLASQCCPERVAIGEKKMPSYFCIAGHFAAWLSSQPFAFLLSDAGAGNRPSVNATLWSWFWSPSHVRCSFVCLLHSHVLGVKRKEPYLPFSRFCYLCCGASGGRAT